jgi:hypothetical protein
MPVAFLAKRRGSDLVGAHLGKFRLGGFGLRDRRLRIEAFVHSPAQGHNPKGRGTEKSDCRNDGSQQAADS